MSLGAPRVRTLVRTGVVAVGLGLMLAFVSPAHTVPILQLYIEGATYDYDTETWVTNQSDLRLLVVGNTSQFGPILDVQLTTAFLTGESGSISITPTTSSAKGATTTGVTDPSISETPILNASVGADGTVPIMSSGDPLPSHGIYGSGVSFNQWALGDFTLADSPIGDFSGAFPTTFPVMGQINAYDISISGYSVVHFDTFNHVEAPSHVLFGPFSHDASTVPEPGTLTLLGLGLAGAAVARKRRRS